jgi:1-acyl-sn-glycerol-3-phosphate acyltransferase
MPTSHQATSTTEKERRESPSLPMRFYAVCWWTGFAVFTCAMWVYALALTPLLVIERRRRLYHLATVCVWGWAVYALNPFWSLRVEGREKLPWDGPAVLVPNHDSLADILVLGALFRPFRFVSKSSVFSVPVLGWAMRLCRYISVTRGNRDSVTRMFEQCRGALADDIPVLMFPEGTRSPDGAVLPFKDGAFRLAAETNAPIHPIILAGTRDALPKHGLIAPLESHVRVRVLDPVDPSEFDGDVVRLREHVRSIVITEKARLTRELES